jgi:carbamate kinase
VRIVVALGGNALGGGETPAEVRERRLATTSGQLADLVEQGHEVIVTHGNGPQVGELMLDQDSRQDDARGEPLPLDVLVAMTQAELGYRLQQALRHELVRRGLRVPVISLITQVVVDGDDPAFQDPTKPVGPGYHTRPVDGGPYVLTRGDRWRRVVPSPAPQELVERSALLAVLDAGVIPVCAGGGGIPVVRDDGAIVGVEAVIDKDLTSALLARDLDADALLILTDIDRVVRRHGRPDAEPLDELTVDEAESMVADGDAASGSMGPKLVAASRAAREGRLAIIAKLGSAAAALAGTAGTRIVADADGGR